MEQDDISCDCIPCVNKNKDKSNPSFDISFFGIAFLVANCLGFSIIVNKNVSPGEMVLALHIIMAGAVCLGICLAHAIQRVKEGNK